MKVPEERLTFPVTLADAVQVGVEGIGQLARTARRIERVGGAIQHGPVFADEVLPGRLVASRACTRQRQVLEVESTRVSG